MNNLVMCFSFDSLFILYGLNFILYFNNFLLIVQVDFEWGHLAKWSDDCDDLDGAVCRC